MNNLPIQTYESVVQQRDELEKKLLAYEQAAKNPIGSFHISGGQVEATTDYCRDGEWPVQDGEVLVYAVPVLPKQPELIGMKVSIDTGSDNIGHRLFGEIVGTSESNGVPVLCIEVTENNVDVAAPAQPVIPEGLIKAINRLLDNYGSRGKFSAVQSYDAREDLERLLAPIAQQNEPQNIPENISTAHSAYISFDALMAAVSEVTGVKREFDATPEKGYQAVPFMNFNSLSRIVEMFRSAQPDQLSMTSERELFKAWNNDIDCPIAGLEPSNAAWRAWISRAAIAPAQPAQPVITEQRQMVPDERPADSSNGNDAEAWFDEGWNACRAEMLKAQPVSEPYKFPQGWIKGQFAYQDLFNAIGAAVVSKHPSIEISVKAFEDSMLAAAPAQGSE